MKKITVMIDDDLNKKILQQQSDIIQKQQISVSYSQVINKTLRTLLK